MTTLGGYGIFEGSEPSKNRHPVMRPFVKTRSLAFFDALFLLFVLWMAKAFSPAPVNDSIPPSGAAF